MRVVITGTGGQVDTSVKILGEKLSIEVICLGLPELDLSRPELFEAPIRDLNPDAIISSAAYTAVDKAESEPVLAQKINGDAPGVLARIARDLNIPILHMSTDYIFDGDSTKPYIEEDIPQPVSIYGKTKLSGENQVREATDNHVILRTAWVYSPYGNNFVKTMLRLGETRDIISVVSDQQGSPTYAPEIARALLAIAQQVVIDPDMTLRGTFHLTGQGSTTWADFAQAIFTCTEALGCKPVKIRHITTAEYPTVAKRPANSRLSNRKLDETYGLRLDPWQISLEDCINQLIHKVT